MLPCPGAIGDISVSATTIGDNDNRGRTTIVSNDRVDLSKKPVLLVLRGDGVDGEEHQFSVFLPCGRSVTRAGGAGAAARQDPRPQAGHDAGIADRQDAVGLSASIMGRRLCRPFVPN